MGYFELDLSIKSDVKAILREVQQFAKKYLRPAGIELDSLYDPADVYEKESSLWDVFKAYRKLDLHTLDIPRQTGGMAGELHYKAGPILVEEMGHGDYGLAVSLEMSNLPFALAAMSPEPDLQILAEVYCKDTDANMIGCWAIPDSGDYLDWLLSDNGAGIGVDTTPEMEAVLRGDEYVINGAITAWTANAPMATHAAVLVSLDPARGIQGSGVAIVPLDLAGISIGKPLDRIGQRTLSRSRIAFEDVKIPLVFMAVSDMEKARPQLRAMHARINTINAAASVGLAQAAYEGALNYAKERVQGGVPISEHKNVKLLLFNMFMKVETARAYNRRVGEYNAAASVGLAQAAYEEALNYAKELVQSGVPISKHKNVKLLLFNMFMKVETARTYNRRVGKYNETAESTSGHHALAAKVFATKSAFEVASDAIAIFGGNGLTKEYPVEKMFRDARVAMLSDGDNNALSISGAEKLTG